MWCKSEAVVTSLQDEHQFVWSDGWPTTYTNWGPGQPNASLADHNCVRLDSHTGLWVSEKCNQRRPFICKYQDGEYLKPAAVGRASLCSNLTRLLDASFKPCLRLTTCMWLHSNNDTNNPAAKSVQESPEYKVVEEYIRTDKFTWVSKPSVVRSVRVRIANTVFCRPYLSLCLGDLLHYFQCAKYAN